MDIHEWPRCIKSVRRKKRLVKLDLDKQLIRLNKTREHLWQQQQDLPMVPLAQPYQRGWKRLFVLRDDIRRGPKADFYEALLQKINTLHYHHDRAFKFKKRRKRRYGYEVKKQELREIDAYEWEYNRLKLSEEERTYFTRVEFMNTTYRRMEIKYVITDPWRFTLKVMPRIITQVKLHDEVLQQEIAAVDSYIDHHFHEPRIHRLTNGRRYRWRNGVDERPKYINKIRNIPRYSQTEAYVDIET
jgi:hypothetical protein